MVKGYGVADIPKWKGKEGVFIGVPRPEMLGAIQASTAKETMAGSYPVKFYDTLAHDPRSFVAIKRYVSVILKLDKTQKMF